MDPEKLVTFSVEYMSDYLTVFFDTITKPRLLFAPIIVESKILIASSVKQKLSFSPRLLGYSTISLIIGLTVQSIIPSSDPIITSIGWSAAIIIIGLWFIYATLASAIFYKTLKGVKFLELISVNMQIISTQYVVSCFFALLWGIISRVPVLNGYLEQLSGFIWLICEEPLLMYFVFQLLLLTIFVPYALINTYRPKRSVYLAVVLLTLMTAGFVVFNLVLWFETGTFMMLPLESKPR